MCIGISNKNGCFPQHFTVGTHQASRIDSDPPSAPKGERHEQSWERCYLGWGMTPEAEYAII